MKERIQKIFLQMIKRNLIAFESVKTDHMSYNGFTLIEITAPQEDFELLDRMLDDGDLARGEFRQTPDSRYTYINEE